MTQITERTESAVIEEAVTHVVQPGHPEALSRLVRDLVDQGFKREQVVSAIHKSIASGALELTDGFMVTRSA